MLNLCCVYSGNELFLLTKVSPVFLVKFFVAGAGLVHKIDLVVVDSVRCCSNVIFFFWIIHNSNIKLIVDRIKTGTH